LCIRPAIPEDFDQIEINYENYEPTTLEIDYAYGMYLINCSENLLTFDSKYGILGIVGVRYGEILEVFSCISTHFKDVLTNTYLRLIREAINVLVGDRPAYMLVYSKKAKRFARFLGFGPTGKFKGESEIYERDTIPGSTNRSVRD
jgi:hypothetical protein